MKSDRVDAYDKSEARVAQWIVDRTGIGGGDDPVGFILASYDLKIAEMNQLREKLAALEAVITQSAKTCGMNNCNCPGSYKVKTMVKEYKEKYHT